jgi:hypothetical protein
MQIVVAEHGDRRATERSDLAQYGERARPAIDQVAHEPQAIVLGRESDCVEQLAELCVTALHVAYRGEQGGRVAIGGAVAANVPERGRRVQPLNAERLVDRKSTHGARCVVPLPAIAARAPRGRSSDLILDAKGAALALRPTPASRTPFASNH